MKHFIAPSGLGRRPLIFVVVCLVVILGLFLACYDANFSDSCDPPVMAMDAVQALLFAATVTLSINRRDRSEKLSAAVGSSLIGRSPPLARRSKGEGVCARSARIYLNLSRSGAAEV